MVTEGAQQVYEACKEIVAAAGADVELESWLELIKKADRHSDGREGQVLFSFSEQLFNTLCRSSS